MKPAGFVAAGILCVGIAAGCGKDATAPQQPSMTGHWQGSALSQFITMTLSESNTSVTGSGTISDGVTTANLSVSGSHNHPQVTLTMTPGGFTPFTAAGTFNGADSVIATLNGSGFSNFAITFLRQ